MKLFKNKKGFDYAILMALVVVIVCLGFLFVQLNKKTGGLSRDIGDMQIGLMLTQQKADSMLFYLDQSAKYSAYSSALALGNNGGFTVTTAACGGDVQNYAVWNTCQDPETICFPGIFDNFNRMINKDINAYFSDYEAMPNTQPFIKGNYIFTVHDSKITGTAIRDIEMNIAPYKPKAEIYSVGRYSFKPSFSIGFNYDFNKFFELRSLAVEIAKCSNKFLIPDERDQCVLKSAPKASLSPNYVFIEIEQPGFASPYSNQKAVIRFALCVPLKGAPLPQLPV